MGRRTDRIRAYHGLSNRPKQAKPLTPENLRKIISKPISPRNKALILVGYFAALRRSELAALHTNQLTTNTDGSITILIPTSKTDQTAQGQTVTIHPAKSKTLCPIQALKEHQTINQIKAGYLFTGTRSENPLDPRTINTIIQKQSKAAGLSEHYTGHSLRRGLLVAAAKRGVDINSLRVHARHTNSAMTERYIGQSALQAKNPTRFI